MAIKWYTRYMPRRKKAKSAVEIVKASSNVKVVINGQVKKVFSSEEEAQAYVSTLK